jgi:trk system potassium uptake protein TrkA
MGCGRVGILLTQELSKAGHEITVIDKNASAFARLPPGFEARTIVGLGFDREVLEDAGIKEADAFLAVASGDNSNIVPKVIARIYDPMRADIYEKLNIPTVSTTRWGVKQMILMLTHPGEEIKETLAAGDLFRMRVEIPSHLVGKPVSSLNLEGRILVAGVDRGGKGFVPVASSTFQEGDYAAVIVQKDALETLDQLLQPIGEH